MITEIIAFIQSNPEYGMIIAFALAMIESLPVIGSFVPGLLTMPPIGWLIATATLPAAETLSLILMGGIIGDYLGYMIGKHCKKHVQTTAAYYNKSSWLDVGENFVSHYGQYSIIIGRFIGPLRSSIPLFAGILNMKRGHFIAAAIPSVILWAALHLAPGFLLAWFDWDILQSPSFLLTCYIGSLATILLVNATRTKLATFGKKFLAQHNLANVDQQYLADTIRILSYATAIAITTTAVMSKTLLPLSTWLLHILYEYHNTTGLSLALLLSNLAETTHISLLCLALTGWLTYNKQTNLARNLFVGFALTFAMVTIAKFLTNIPRPEFIAAHLSQQAFPSGHTALAIALIMGLQPLLKEHQTIRTAGWLFLLIIPCTRLYLGAHWLSDIIGATFIALFCVAITPSIMQVCNQYFQWHTHPISNDSLLKPLFRILIAYGIFITLLGYTTGQLSPSVYHYVSSSLS